MKPEVCWPWLFVVTNGTSTEIDFGWKSSFRYRAKRSSLFALSWVKGLVDLVNELETQKVHFQSITDGVDTKTPAGRFFFHVMASLAQMGRELILERTRAGLEAARCAGRVGGRKRRMTDGKVQAEKSYWQAGRRHEMADSLGVSVPTLYRWVPASSRT